MSESVESTRKAGAAPAARAPLSTPGRRFDWRLALGLVVWTLLLFGIGYGASRLIRTLDAHPMLVAQTTSGPPRILAATPYGVSVADIEALPWREAAAKINPAQAQRILADADHGDAYARTVACLAHMAGVAGFLPSPAAARGFCDAAAQANYRPALYLSWALYRSAPHAGIDEATARARLAEAARRGLAAAQIDYALLLAPNTNAPMPDQVEAGRLWFAAAESGDARGQFYYARWLRDSPAGPRDPSAAAPFLERAAGAEQSDAAHMLATLYRDGVGVTRDRDRAKVLYEQAAARDFAPSMFNLADLLRETEAARAVALYRRLACMHDERQISAMAAERLQAMRQAAMTCE